MKAAFVCACGKRVACSPVCAECTERLSAALPFFDAVTADPTAVSDEIRGLSLTQPYATAIARGVKTVETRSFLTRYRGRIAVHAAIGFPKWAREFASVEHMLGRIPDRIPLGAIVAVARIADCRPTLELETQVSAIERLYGDYSPGRWAWILSDVVALPEPIPCKGALGLWKVPAEIARSLHGGNQ